MARRFESLLPSLALYVLFGLALIYGCRAFDPEPVVVNRPPQTFIVGAAQETTGSRFLRHMYWYGTDSDGEVIRFIYAITDSSVRDIDEPDTDEEDARFNPALDITTLETIPGRLVGYTARTDSVFLFPIDRGDTPSKEVTFHLVAQDDRGAYDQTPARLRFLNNSLGNPTLRFSVSTEEQTSSGLDWVLRWTGNAVGPDAASPETTQFPFVGFGRRFRIEWEASSPNGPIEGYRFKASQDATVGFTPRDIGGNPQFSSGPEFEQFVYDNSVAPDAFPVEVGCDPVTLNDCPPETLRWPSKDYRLRVTARDVALVESEAVAGELRFEVNYPPESSILADSNFPNFKLPVSGGTANSGTFAALDTIPSGSYARFRMAGFDRYPDSIPPDDPFGSSEFGVFCCDDRLDAGTPEVRFQGQLVFLADKGQGRVERFQTLFSNAIAADTLGFDVGPFTYTFLGRTEDEHGRRDPEASTFQFVGGFPPSIENTSPAAGDTILLRSPPQTWPGNDFPYDPPTTVTRWWDGVQYLPFECTDCPSVAGFLFKFKFRFQGAPDFREPDTTVRSWTYSMQSEFDPNNLFQNGPAESADFSFFTSSSSGSLLQFDNENAAELFIPSQAFFLPQLFDSSSPNEFQRQLGAEMKRGLGQHVMRVLGRTTTFGDMFKLYSLVRPGSGTPFVNLDMSDKGRRTPVADIPFTVLLGIDSDFDGVIDRYWPDEDS